VARLFREYGALPSDAVDKALRIRDVQVQRRPIEALDFKGIRLALTAALRLDRDQGRPIAGPLVLTALLTGLRKEEMERLGWSDVDLEAEEGRGVLRLDEQTKTKKPRQVGLDISPSVRALMAAMRLQAGDRLLVFDDASLVSLMRRVRAYGAVRFSWQVARRTCAGFGCSAPGASVHLTADRLGHRYDVCRGYYANPVRGIDPKAKTLEAAMGIEDLAERIVRSVQPRLGRVRLTS
jgi:integrase